MGAFEWLPADEDRTAALDLAKRIASDSWVLFGGAGVSMPSGLPLASRLIDHIETDLGLSQGTLNRNDLAKACSQYQFTDICGTSWHESPFSLWAIPLVTRTFGERFTGWEIGCKVDPDHTSSSPIRSTTGGGISLPSIISRSLSSATTDGFSNS
jgi:hypothetical protein